MRRLARLALAVALGACGGAQRTRTPKPTLEDPFDGLPALSRDGATVAVPIAIRTDYGPERSVSFVAVGELWSEDSLEVSAVETGMEEPGDPPADPEQLIAALARRLDAEGFRSLPWESLAAPTAPFELEVDGVTVSITGTLAEGLVVSAREKTGELGRAELDPVEEDELGGDPIRLVAAGAAVVRAGRTFVYVMLEEAGGFQGSGTWSTWVVLPQPPDEPIE